MRAMGSSAAADKRKDRYTPRWFLNCIVKLYHCYFHITSIDLFIHSNISLIFTTSLQEKSTTCFMKRKHLVRISDLPIIFWRYIPLLGGNYELAVLTKTRSNHFLHQYWKIGFMVRKAMVNLLLVLVYSPSTSKNHVDPSVCVIFLLVSLLFVHFTSYSTKHIIISNIDCKDGDPAEFCFIHTWDAL